MMVMGTMFLTIAIVNAFLDDQDTKAKGKKEETRKQWYWRKGKRGRGKGGTTKTGVFFMNFFSKLEGTYLGSIPNLRVLPMLARYLNCQVETDGSKSKCLEFT
jgi:hypothetical protein